MILVQKHTPSGLEDSNRINFTTSCWTWPAVTLAIGAVFLLIRFYHLLYAIVYKVTIISFSLHLTWMTLYSLIVLAAFSVNCASSELSWGLTETLRVAKRRLVHPQELVVHWHTGFYCLFQLLMIALQTIGCCGSHGVDHHVACPQLVAVYLFI